VTNSNREVVEKSQMIVLAVKPNVVSPVLQEVSQTVSKEKLVVSIAGGITISFIEQVYLYIIIIYMF
jgi:pyrroline-5-carboxylate reductase